MPSRLSSRNVRRKRTVRKPKLMRSKTRKHNPRRYAGVKNRSAAALARAKTRTARRVPVRKRKVTYQVRPVISTSAYLSMF